MQLIDHYEEISSASGRMLDAATRNDWEGLVRAERECAMHIDMVRALSPMGLSPDEAKRKSEIITQVLMDDAKIRLITEPWVAQLQDLLRGSHTERKLSQHYG